MGKAWQRFKCWLGFHPPEKGRRNYDENPLGKIWFNCELCGRLWFEPYRRKWWGG